VPDLYQACSNEPHHPAHTRQTAHISPAHLPRAQVQPAERRRMA
jgi:hypothetical protein